jgi:ribosomal protein S18 acetylase RimI-like enzyme
MAAAGPPAPLATASGEVRFAEETGTIEPDELGRFFDTQGIDWTVGRTATDWRRLLESSRLLGARLSTTSELVGTLRLWSDHVYEAKIYDVVVAAALRGHGVGSALVAWALRDPWATETRAVVLETRDAVALYRRFGFVTAEEADLVHLRRA